MWPTIADSVRSVRGVLVDGIRAEMILMPLIEKLFQRIAMDIVGPLPRSWASNKYIRTICDYATCYPEAIPLPSTEAKRIAKELVKLFARVGILDKILSDQGTSEFHVHSFCRKSISHCTSKARPRMLDPGDKVVVLVPARYSKLQLEWAGPYKVTRRITPVDYEVEIPGRRMEKKINHVNLLKKWHFPLITVLC